MLLFFAVFTDDTRKNSETLNFVSNFLQLACKSCFDPEKLTFFLSSAHKTTYKSAGCYSALPPAIDVKNLQESLAILNI